MDRTFQSKVDRRYWLVIGVSSLLLLYFFWVHCLWLTVLMAAAVIFEIEMLVYTRYVVTSGGELKIESGRFIPNLVIPVGTIRSVRRTCSRSLFSPALSSDCLEIEYGEEGKKRKVCVSPKNQDTFVQSLLKLNAKIRKDDR